MVSLLDYIKLFRSCDVVATHINAEAFPGVRSNPILNKLRGRWDSLEIGVGILCHLKSIRHCISPSQAHETVCINFDGS